MIVGIVIQARMDPAAFLQSINGCWWKTLLEFLYSRLQPLVEKYSVFVTTLNDADDVIVADVFDMELLISEEVK